MMKTTSILSRVILFAVLILSVNQAFPQSKFEISGGFGFPDVLNLGIKYGNKFRVGIHQSIWYPDGYGGPTSIVIYYHFGGKSKFSERPPWYCFGGLGYYWGYEDNDVYFYPRIGRSFNFSKKSGINLDGGAFFPINNELREFMDSPIYPSGSISFFIRL